MSILSSHSLGDLISSLILHVIIPNAYLQSSCVACVCVCVTNPIFNQPLLEFFILKYTEYVNHKVSIALSPFSIFIYLNTN